ncbi:unnamed protein product [Symbiodinium natans]|uniref:Uncharacterized protein n=1 Tax=Symbiodinium natans TaxID=878477 RepID=A0A812UM40_9DINO|nr:unnamed protein product [Symbiodinium natans]
MQVGAEVADNLDKVGSGAVVDLSLPRHATELERERSRVCCLCKAPSSATNHVCPACHASVCYPCARTELSERRCPACGDAEKNSEPLGQFLAAGEVGHATRRFGTTCCQPELPLKHPLSQISLKPP